MATDAADQPIVDEVHPDGHDVDAESGDVTVTPAGKPRVDLSKVPKDMLPYVEAARAQEKQKLYPQLSEARRLLKETQDRVAALTAAGASPAEKKDDQSEVGELKKLVLSLQQTIEKRDRDSTLRAYRAERIGELKAQGIKLVESLVAGESEEQIDLAIEVAKAERAQIEAELEAEFAAREDKKPRSTSVVVQQGKPGRPGGVPPTVTPGQAGDAGPTMTAEELKELTSMDAIRDGRYKANKVRIMAALRSQAVITGAGRA
jgi:hypothetical protein